jgi:hypothetical protein
VSLTVEELLAGSAITHPVRIPPELLVDQARLNDPAEITIRPLTVRDVQRIAKAAGEDVHLSGALMIQQSLVEPDLSAEQAATLPAGLARFLLQRINEVSGMDPPADALAELVQAPLARACFVLAKEFGWTPEEVSGMTIGQILLYLEMSGREGGAA